MALEGTVLKVEGLLDSHFSLALAGNWVAVAPNAHEAEALGDRVELSKIPKSPMGTTKLTSIAIRMTPPKQLIAMMTMAMAMCGFW
ncbi:hypothetical protein N9L68_05465 [bacterium]|nr:hypothetical protein [bacterium]